MPFKKGQSGNPGGLTKEEIDRSKNFKSFCFDLFEDNEETFKETILGNKEYQMKFLGILAGFVPQKTEVTGKDGKDFSGSIVILPAKQGRIDNGTEGQKGSLAT